MGHRFKVGDFVTVPKGMKYGMGVLRNDITGHIIREDDFDYDWYYTIRFIDKKGKERMIAALDSEVKAAKQK